MAVKDKASAAFPIDCIISTAAEPMEWSAEEEIQLFKALGGLKPIGINKHFYMACICERLSTALKRDINPDVVWAHLHTMYNLDMLDSLEPLPFPQIEQDFALPADADFAALMARKLQATAKATEGGDGGQTTAVTAAAAVVSEPEKQQRVSERSGTASPVVKSRTATPQPQSSGSSTSTIANAKPTTNVHRSSVGTRASTPNPSTPVASTPISATSIAASAGNSSTVSSVSAVVSVPTTTTSTTTSSTTTGSSSGGGSHVHNHHTGSSGGSGASTPLQPSVVVPSVKSITQKEVDKKLAKISAAAVAETPKRPPKRTRGSKSIESNSPSTTPPPTSQTKRRRI